MGRVNVYLPEDLERRVRAAQIPISEVTQRALLAAVEQAEASAPFDTAIRVQYDRGTSAGLAWAAIAPLAAKLELLRDQRFTEIPSDSLPADLYTLNQDESLAWEAGFAEAARSAARAFAASGAAATAAEVDPDADTGSDGPPLGLSKELVPVAADSLGDDSGSQIGVTIDGEPVSFDPHAAVRAGKSPLFAVLGDATARARLNLSIAQDAASRGAAVVILDISGQLTPRANGLGRNVRVIRSQGLPQLDDLMRGGGGIGGLLGSLSNLSSGGLASGAGLLGMLGGRSHDKLVEPGYVSVLNLSGDAALGTALSAAQGLAGLTSPASFPRLILIDLPASLSIPAAISGRLGRLVRTAREQNAAIGISADSAETATQVAGGGALLSTVIAFATSSPAEADRLRGLLGAGAPVLLNPPGTSAAPGDETWAVMRDLEGRLGQVRIEAS